MKRVLLFLFLSISVLGFNQTLTLDSLYVSSSGSPEAIEVTVVVSHPDYFTYVGSSYTINLNEIDLSVCYFLPNVTSPTETTITKKLYVFLPTDITDFVLNVNLYNSQSATSCDYYEALDSANLSFSMPLIDTVFLSNGGVQEKQESFISVYPNPAQNHLNINTNGKSIESIQLYSILGKKVMEKNTPGSVIDLSNIENGIYFLVVETSEGTLKKKIVVSK